MLRHRERKDAWWQRGCDMKLMFCNGRVQSWDHIKLKGKKKLCLTLYRLQLAVTARLDAQKCAEDSFSPQQSNFMPLCHYVLLNLLASCSVCTVTLPASCNKFQYYVNMKRATVSYHIEQLTAFCLFFSPLGSDKDILRTILHINVIWGAVNSSLTFIYSITAARYFPVDNMRKKIRIWVSI